MMEGKYMKILIVDDEENILEIVEAYLVAKNYQVFRAMDGEEWTVNTFSDKNNKVSKMI